MRGARLRIVPLVTSIALAAAHCGPARGTQEPYADTEVVAPATNPDGAPYPQGGWGARPRLGRVPGDRLPNMAFHAYVDSDESRGLSTVSFADYYDPSAKRYRVLHLMVAAAWCGVCAAQTEDMVRTSAKLSARGLVSLQLVIQGRTLGKAPSLAELETWIDRHETPFSVGFDALGKRLGVIADLSSVPWNALVDLRTMEILRTESGAPESFEAFATGALDWVEQEPPAELP